MSFDARPPSGSGGVCPTFDPVADHGRNVRRRHRATELPRARQGLFHVETARLGVSDSCEQRAVSRALADLLEAFWSES